MGWQDHTVVAELLAEWLEPFWLDVLTDAGFSANDVVLLPVEGNAFTDDRPAMIAASRRDSPDG